MKAFISLLLSALFLPLPSFLKIPLIRIFFRAKIGRDCYIGFSLVNVDRLSMDDCTYIGHLNLIWRLKKFSLKRGARVSHGNWITGARVGAFELGHNSAVTTFHFLEASGGIFIGSNSILAGRGSQLFTHGLTVDCLDDVRAIAIGDWCYIGSSIKIVPGTEIPDGCFAGMGAVLVGKYPDTYSLLLGVPAKAKKKYTGDEEYFARDYLPHRHHPIDYEG